MRDSAAGIFRLLENLLEWSITQQGLMPFNPDAVQLRPLVAESMAMAQEPAKSKGIEITYDVPDDMTVFAESNMLQTVIRNLVSNAVKFTSKGGKISLSAKTAGDRSIEISIKDSGIGMNKALVDNLFRLDIKTNRKGTANEPGSGLGLLLCK
jgi:signal transduction histidine kinase